jgi:hypothetical protein
MAPPKIAIRRTPADLIMTDAVKMETQIGVTIPTYRSTKPPDPPMRDTATAAQSTNTGRTAITAMRA